MLSCHTPALNPSSSFTLFIFPSAPPPPPPTNPFFESPPPPPPPLLWEALPRGSPPKGTLLEVLLEWLPPQNGKPSQEDLPPKGDPSLTQGDPTFYWIPLPYPPGLPLSPTPQDKSGSLASRYPSSPFQGTLRCQSGYKANKGVLRLFLGSSTHERFRLCVFRLSGTLWFPPM